MKTTGAAPAINYSREQWTPLLEVAAREVFELMLSCHLTAPETLTAEPMNITSMVGLAGKLRGVLSIRCSAKSGAIMASKMLGEEQDKVGSELPDALGELCNMVAGNFKNKIAGLGDGCMLSVPTVIIGSDYDLHSLADSDTLELKLLFEDSPLVISLAIHS